MYSNTYFIRLEVVDSGASHLVGLQDDFLLNKWISECQVLSLLLSLGGAVGAAY